MQIHEKKADENQIENSFQSAKSSFNNADDSLNVLREQTVAVDPISVIGPTPDMYIESTNQDK